VKRNRVDGQLGAQMPPQQLPMWIMNSLKCSAAAVAVDVEHALADGQIRAQTLSLSLR